MSISNPFTGLGLRPALAHEGEVGSDFTDYRGGFAGADTRDKPEKRLLILLGIIASTNAMTQRQHIGYDRSWTLWCGKSNPMFQRHCPFKAFLITTDRACIAPILQHKCVLLFRKGVRQSVLSCLAPCIIQRDLLRMLRKIFLPVSTHF